MCGHTDLFGIGEAELREIIEEPEHVETGPTDALCGKFVSILGLFSVSDFLALFSFSAPKISEAFLFGGSGAEDMLQSFAAVIEAPSA
jgi:hypothetical protein